jgi:hypothetical protein
MDDYANKKVTKPQPVKGKNAWAQFCFFSGPKKRKHDRIEDTDT